MLRLPADGELVDDLERMRVDDLHRIANGVRYVHPVGKALHVRAEAPRPGAGIYVLPIEKRRHAREVVGWRRPGPGRYGEHGDEQDGESARAKRSVNQRGIAPCANPRTWQRICLVRRLLRTGEVSHDRAADATRRQAESRITGPASK